MERRTETVDVFLWVAVSFLSVMLLHMFPIIILGVPPLVVMALGILLEIMLHIEGM